MQKNERLLALKILSSLMLKKNHLTQLFNQYKATPFVKELCFGVTRHYFHLQAIALHLVAKPVKNKDVWLALLIGLYQINYLNTPDFAAVKETVDLLGKLKKPWAKGLINAVLRKFCREQSSIIASLQNDLLFSTNHSSWFVEKIQQHWPLDWETILQANDTHPPMTLRVNTQCTNRSTYLEALAKNKILASPTIFSEQGITLEKPCNVTDLPGFLAGEISVQDEAAQIAASLLDLQSNMRVLDACCAPGGKTAHMLELVSNLHCVAIDLEGTRLEKVQENLNRLHLSAKMIAADATKVNEWWDKIPFDRILLDAPCSATGVIRRHPDIKILRTLDAIAEIQLTQEQLLLALWPLLKPGGLFLYATCSIMKEENELQVQKFLSHCQDAEVVFKKVPWGRTTGYGWQILPGDNNMDGFFYCLLRKKYKEPH